MAAVLEQINVSYQAETDRLLLRVRSKAEEEFRFWMTRRFTRVLLDALCKTIANERGQSDGDALNAGARLAFDHDRATVAADFSTPYKENADSFPIGEDGVLGYQVKVDQGQIHLLPKNGAGIALPLQPALLHNLQHLISRAACSADWNLPGELTPAAPDPAKRVLN